MAETIKQRLLVMNGQRLLQVSQAGEWATKKVDKAGALKPGIYDLHLSIFADKAKSYDGPVLFADQTSVYQKVGKDYIKHAREHFSSIPQAGTAVNIRYDGEKATLAASSLKLATKRSR